MKILESSYVTSARLQSDLIEKLAQVIDDAGGDPDAVVAEMMSTDESWPSIIGKLMVDSMIKPMLNHPIEIHITPRFLQQISTDFDVVTEGFDSIPRRWEASNGNQTARYQIYRTPFGMQNSMLNKFCRTRWLAFPSVSEILQVVTKINFRESVPSFYDHRPEARILGITVKYKGYDHSLEIYPPDSDNEQSAKSIYLRLWENRKPYVKPGNYFIARLIK